ncbi:hypothetical protein DERF_002314 [Dermatophagoides farinae]|uniref:Uncharacterized protein n=1 Tax=Dermatophagoides farinae TaxID=6954 RepID=A0A922IBA3_DERFA|nr:hypothetical protein DERF_002314 [Dermatophagoides farinae]
MSSSGASGDADYPLISDKELISQNSINNDHHHHHQPPPLRRGSWKSVGQQRRRSSYRIIDDDSHSDDCLIRLIKDACLAHCRKNNVKINDSNVLNILNEVIGDIKMIIMIDERNTDNDQHVPNKSSTIHMEQMFSERNSAMMKFIDSLTNHILNDCLERLKNTPPSLAVVDEDSFESKKVEIFTEIIPPKRRQSVINNHVDNVDDDDDDKWWKCQVPRRKRVTEIYIDAPDLNHCIHFYHDLFDSFSLPLQWIQPESMKMNDPRQHNNNLDLDLSEFIQCQVEVRQIGTSIKSTRQSRFLQRRRLISYAEICEYPLVLCIDFYYISGFVPRCEIRCPTMERTPEPPEQQSPIEDDLYFDEYAPRYYNDQEAEDPEVLLQKLQEQQDYLERRRRSKHFWWEQSHDDHIQTNFNNVYVDDVNNNNNQSTSDYHEEDEGQFDEEYRENSYDHYILDDNDAIQSGQKVRFADQIDHLKIIFVFLNVKILSANEATSFVY